MTDSILSSCPGSSKVVIAFTLLGGAEVAKNNFDANKSLTAGKDNSKSGSSSKKENICR